MTGHFANQSSPRTQTPFSDELAFSHYGMTTAEAISLTVFSSGISVIGTISNILVIFAILVNRRLRESCTAMFLVSLSCFDLIICAVFEPMYIYDINYGSSAILEAVRNKFGFGLFLGSLNSAFAVSLDRFIAICFPYHYVEWVTEKFTFIVIFLTWFVAVALTALSVPINPPLYSFVYIAAIILLIISFHITMYWVARREARQIARLYPLECQRFSIWGKSAKAITMVIAAFLLCWVPIVITPAFVLPSSPSFLRSLKIALAFTSLSSAINPFIFCWRLADFRKALCSRLRQANAVIHPN